MNIKQIENLYKNQGIDNNKLRNTQDLLIVHGIEYKDIKGYDALDDLNKTIYKRFIVKFLNAWGLEDRVKITPEAIYWVKEVKYLAEDDNERYIFPKDDDNLPIVIGTAIFSIKKDGTYSKLYEWEEEEYKHLKIIDKKENFYLRFEYEYDDKKEWQHVIDEGKDWY